MNAGKNRLLRLKRLERIRDIARIEALERAATAERLFARQAELARRSDELAQAFAQRWEAQSGCDLRDLRSFHAGLEGLSRSISRDSEQARVSADHHRMDAAAASRKRDLVSEQLSTASRRQMKAQTAKQLSENPHLARSLNNS